MAKQKGYSSLEKWAFKNKKQFKINYEDYEAAKKAGCEHCKSSLSNGSRGCRLKPYKRKISIENLEFICNDCVRTKKVQKFELDKIKWAKSRLRYAFKKTPTYAYAIRRCKIGNIFLCENCNTQVDWIEIDHINAVAISKTLDEWIDRLLCSPDQLQGLCKPCHKIKTSEDLQKIKEFKEFLLKDVDKNNDL